MRVDMAMKGEDGVVGAWWDMSRSFVWIVSDRRRQVDDFQQERSNA